MVKTYTFNKTVKPFIDSDKTENRKYFVLEINNNRFIVSNPRIECDDDFESIEDARFFYYNTQIDFATYEKDDNNKEIVKWNELVKGGAYEFASLLALCDAIDYIKDYDLINDISRREYFLEKDGTRNKTDFESNYQFDFGSMFEEDIYNFTKHHRHFDSNYNAETDRFEETDYIWYSLYIGISRYDAGNTIGFKCSKIEEYELDIIKKWCTNFLSYAVDKTRKTIQNDLEER